MSAGLAAINGVWNKNNHDQAHELGFVTRFSKPWLCTNWPCATLKTSQPDPTPTYERQDSELDEAHILDKQCNLIGVLSRPPATAKKASAGIIFYNAGFLHHVGPNRINTTLARALAKRGFNTLRFDFSGLGDSQSHTGFLDNSAIVKRDAALAMDFLEQTTGVNRFVLIGFCSGAVDALHIAREEERVIGLLAVDGIGFRNKKFYWYHLINHTWTRLFSIAHWHRKLNRVTNRVRVTAANRHRNRFKEPANSEQALTPNEKRPDQAHAIVDDAELTRISKDEFGQILRQLAKRPVSMRFAYTGGTSHYYNYHQQFQDTFPEWVNASAVSSCYYPDADHLFMLKKHRESLLSDTCDWVSSHFS